MSWNPHFNRYWYANNNPYTFADPDGRESGCLYANSCGNFSHIGVESAGAIADFVPIVGDIKGIADAISDPTIISVTAAGVGLVPVVGDAVAKGLKAVGDVAETAAKVGKVPKPPTGPGTVPKSERDPKRFFTPSERAAKRAEQNGGCGTGCGTQIDGSNSAGHHIKRHADGGQTVPENHVEVCLPCHDKIHSGDSQ